MQIKLECIPCILAMSAQALRKLNLDDDLTQKLYTDILTIPDLRGERWDRTSPDIIEIIMGKISRAIGNDDPFQDEKTELNNRVMAMQPLVQKMVDQAADPVYTAAKLAILGNAIDFMMPGGTHAFEDYIKEKMRIELVEEPFATFRRHLSHTRKIVYFTDNCGEIVLDKLFIRTLKQQFDIDVTIVVRHVPTLNDATLKEAEAVGLDAVGTLIDNGIDGPLCGTILERCSSQVQSLAARADLIVSKGGGNFDSLSEQLDIIDTSITFMLLSKCRPINTFFNTVLHQPVIANFFKQTRH